jgi:phosphoglycerate dehydrogenase-like enzyme
MRRFCLIALGVSLALLPLVALAQERPKIVVANLSPAQLLELEAAAPADFVSVSSPEEALQRIADADALVGVCNLDLIRAGKRLKWIQVYSAGVDRYRFPELRDSDITLTNCKIIQGPEIADHAMAMLLALTRRLNEFIPLRMKRAWRRSGSGLIELNGKTALIIGLGGIGTQIAQRASAFGMRVLAVDPKDIPYVLFVEKVVKPDQLRDVLPEADVVFMSAPHTAQTERMMGSEEFGMMKKGSYFIAVSRGKTYDGKALAKALEEKHLAGAGVDVTDPEPLPEDDPLWQFENVIITPHIAGQSDKVWDRRMALLKENVRRFTESLPLLNVVNKQKWY